MKIPEAKVPLMEVVPSVDCNEKLPPVHDQVSVSPVTATTVRLQLMVTVPAGLLRLVPLMVRELVVILTVPPLLLYDDCDADNTAAEASTRMLAQSTFIF